jgi:hypothetical protein
MEGVRREVALRLGAATKARRWMSRRWPRPVTLAVRNRKGSEVARGEEDNGEEVERWKTLRRRVGLYSGWRWSLGRGAGDGRRWQNGSRGEARLTEEEESRQGSEGPICKLKNFQGLLCKEKFSIDRKS